MSPKNSSSGAILKKLGGFILELNSASMGAVDYINAHDAPKVTDLEGVSNGGDNIWYGSPGNGLPDWGSFDKIMELLPFMDQVQSTLFDHWGNNKDIVFNYQTDFIYSKLSTTSDNVPQKAYQDHDSVITDKEHDIMKIKSMIAFTPISEDGMMIVVWTEGKVHKQRRNRFLKIT